MTSISAWAAPAAGQPLQRYSFDPGPLGAQEVEIAVEHCGLCHSDLSMLDDEWGQSRYPLVPGHEAVGRVVALGEEALGLTLGQRVGLGWTASSCMHCRWCLGGDQQLCPKAQGTIVGRHGAFAERVRAHWAWVVPLPEALDPASAGPLLCGGITVFTPLHDLALPPTAHVGVVGIGGLGHLALQFASAWGCEVTAFSSSASKHAEALRLGAHRVVDSTDPAAMAAIAGTLDLIIYTANAALDWEALMATLAPRGRLHVVGAVLQPIAVSAFTLIGGFKSVSGSPTGSRGDIEAMLDFTARHRVEALVERFPMSGVNEALAHLRAGKARYRVVLDADFD
ncbi:NADPH-dependent aldehyde reductase Ahr [Azohydromonas caseinilytica]|uniref:alcohol dehydrogenase (NADP(+)) n=1 Tax=Azohydromonas caseinilytica TaxID=2728836 RepID=A0A848F949_9BURK|nr:NAD(P)-dependent alcohol dehydrogenase [Azohydromonas caseinilytica]NML15872.1 NAD(P)-dependent alcohol dehydrogenase [Azohydromonas caseinilytica]